MPCSCSFAVDPAPLIMPRPCLHLHPLDVTAAAAGTQTGAWCNRKTKRTGRFSSTPTWAATKVPIELTEPYRLLRADASGGRVCGASGALGDCPNRRCPHVSLCVASFFLSTLSQFSCLLSFIRRR